jgi:hypothetical protein
MRAEEGRPESTPDPDRELQTTASEAQYSHIPEFYLGDSEEDSADQIPCSVYLDNVAEEVPDDCECQATIGQVYDSLLAVREHLSDTDDDPDSYEAQARREDQELFPMEEILAGHEDRLRSAAPYRVPTSLLQSGAETPLRAEDDGYDMTIGSRPTSPASNWISPAPVQSRAATPTYIPPDNVARDATLPFLPESRHRTPLLARDATPLFLPSSRNPTPFLPREETPYFFPALPQYNVSIILFKVGT